MSSVVIAMIAALFGGAGLKIIEHFLSRGKTKIDIARELRTELRDEVLVLRDEVKELDKRVDKWKHKYFDCQNRMADMYSELRECDVKMKHMATLLAVRHDESPFLTETMEMQIDDILNFARAESELEE